MTSFESIDEVLRRRRPKGGTIMLLVIADDRGKSWAASNIPPSPSPGSLDWFIQDLKRTIEAKREALFASIDAGVERALERNETEPTDDMVDPDRTKDLTTLDMPGAGPHEPARGE